ncbi:MAG: prepilin-type N-terminal cleavage/methylation domain-containing protein [Gemmatimonadota bacterium]|nr:prepilin-type N-terminal cleavage/methylation domain-containing protein [Gemmatimonadota bacterium]
MRTRRIARRGRAGLTLVEIIIAISILSAAMLGFSRFINVFQRSSNTSSNSTLASDLASQRLETVKGYRVYSSLVSTYNNTTETFTTGTYKGFTRTTAAVRCSGCPTTTNDYITVTVSVTGNGLSAPVKRTTIIAAF